MTDITRIFNVETRGFTNVQRRYSGQIGDATSTVMHFEYNPIDFLAHTEDNEWYVPYIQFAVYDENGNPYTYGPVAEEREDGSVSQVFDGYTFSIPWEITSNVKSQRVEYQLFFIRNTVDVDPTQSLADQLVQTDYIRSAMDGITLKPSIACKKKQKTACAVPGAVAPTIGGFIEFFKEYSYIYPVKHSMDIDNGQLSLEFKTYNGKKDTTLVIDVAPLMVDEDGNRTIPVKFLRRLDSGILEEVEPEEWNDYFASVADDTKMPTNKLMADLLSMKLDDSQLINEWSETPSEEKIPSEALVLDELEGFTKKEMAVPEWNSEMDYHLNSTVMYEANIYISLQDDNMGHEPSTDVDVEDEWWSTVSEYDILLKRWNDRPVTNKAPNEKMVVEALDTKLDGDQLVTEWSTPLDNSHIPSEYLVKSSLDAVDGEIAEEREARIAADTVLQDNIDAEATARTTADTTLQANIDSEASERASMDDALRTELDNKTDITEAIPVWTADRIFYADSSVIYGESVWISLRDNNAGHIPGDDDSWWVEISGSGGGGGGPSIKHKTIQFGNDTDTEYTLTHNLVTYDFLYSIRTNDSTRHYVLADVYASSNTTVTVRLTSPPGKNGLIINLLDIGGGSSGGTTVEVIAITEPSSVWRYTNSTGRPVFIQAFEYVDELGMYDQIQGDIEQTSQDNFTDVADVFTEDHTGSMVVVKSELVYSFENQSTWVIEHNMGEFMAVQCFNDQDGQIQGDIDQTGNVVTVVWGEPTSGYCVLMEPSQVETIAAGTEPPKTITHDLERFVAVQVYSATWGQEIMDVHQNGTDTIYLNWEGVMDTNVTVLIV